MTCTVYKTSAQLHNEAPLSVYVFAALFLLLFTSGCPSFINPVFDGGADANSEVPLVVFIEAMAGDTVGRYAPGFHRARVTGLDEARLDIQDFRVIGDAVPDDERTTLRALNLEWEEREVHCLAFPGAPPGIYSRVRARVVSYRISGSVEDSGTLYSFTISDTPPQGITVTVDVDEVLVDIHETGEIPLELDIDHVVDALDWAGLDDDGDGEVELDSESPDIVVVRARVSDLFQPGDEAENDECDGAMRASAGKMSVRKQ